MKHIVFIFLFTIYLSSYVCLKKNVDNSNGITLTESNLTLLNGKYELASINFNEDLLAGDLLIYLFGNTYWGFFNCYHIRYRTESLELQVISKNKILVTYTDENRTIKSNIMKGKIKNGYYCLCVNF